MFLSLSVPASSLPNQSDAPDAGADGDVKTEETQEQEQKPRPAILVVCAAEGCTEKREYRNGSVGRAEWLTCASRSDSRDLIAV